MIIRRLPAVWLAVLCAILAWTGPNSAAAAGRREHSRKFRYIIRFREGLSSQERERFLSNQGMTRVEELEEFNAAVVEAFNDLASVASQEAGQNAQVMSFEEDVYRKWLLDSPSLSQTPLPSMDAVMRGLPKINAAGGAGFGGRAGGAPSFEPPDISLPPSAGIGEVESSRSESGWADQGEFPWGIQRVNSPGAWNKDDPSSMGQGVKVAVVDTGIDCTHPDLTCDYSEGYNAIDPSQSPADDNEHGTHVAGTIAAKLDGRGVAGVAPLAHLIPVKVLDKDGGGTLSAIVKGIMWAAKHGARVINMSLGAPQDSQTLHQAVRYAYQHGVTVVCAAGNSGPGSDTVSYPGAYPEVIAVGAGDSKDQVASFSSRGPQVALIAPGVNILSSVPGGGYAKHSGTSMAAPHVTGLAALAIAKGASGPDAVRGALAAAASELPGLAAEDEGYGLVDAAKIGSGN